jgi:3-oxoacyl-[acyl-carrier-protein] synthase III
VTGGPDGVRIGSFARDFGEQECKPEDIPEFEKRWMAEGAGTSFSLMGCGTFRKMVAPVEDHIVRCIEQTLAAAGVAADSVDHIIISTKDLCLAAIGGGFVPDVLDRVGLTCCTPLLLSLQRCSVSLTALDYAQGLFADPAVRNVVVVAFDVTPDDADRIRSFAVFGDAVTSCLLRRADGPGFRLLSSAVRVDYEGLFGRDSFTSRQEVASRAVAQVVAGSGEPLVSAAAIFPTNLFKPLTMFNAAAAGLDAGKLHFADSLAAYGHCGDCDWMINLMHYDETVGVRAGDSYVVLASSPGFFAGAQLRAVA